MSESVEVGTFVLMGSYFMISTSPSNFWSMVNGIQMTAHLPLLQVQTPANAGFFLNHMV